MNYQLEKKMIKESLRKQKRKKRDGCVACCRV